MPTPLSPKPVFTSNAPTRVSIGAQYRYKPTAFDSLGKSIYYSIKQIPSWLQFDAAKRELKGKALKAGQYLVQIDADNGEQVASQYFMITVTDSRTKSILCIGNSLTNGTNVFNSYRRPLWRLLHEANFDFDFIGSWNRHHMGGEVPNPDFDMDHDGHSGWTMEHILRPPDWDTARGNIDQWLKHYKPDLVLFELGTNDVFQCRKLEDIRKDLQEIARKLRRSNPRVRLFLARIPALGPQWADKKLCGNDTAYDAVLQEVNRLIETFSRKNSTSLSPIIVVDQYTGLDPATMMYDDIHPNDKGEERMARAWFDAIWKELNKLR